MNLISAIVKSVTTRALKDVLIANANNVLYIIYDFETTQNKTYSDTAKEHVPNLVCVQQFCARCEEIEDCSIDCGRCGKGKAFILE